MNLATLNLLFVVFLSPYTLVAPVHGSIQTGGSHLSEGDEANDGLNSNRKLYSSIQDMPSFASLWKRSSPDTGTLLATSKRIVGGTVAQEYPSYGFSAGTDLCGGMLIHPDILLSAAHCKGVFLDGVMMGGTDIFGRESTYHRTALEFPHPDYDDNGFDSNDIMLVKLDTPSTAPLAVVNFDPNFPPVGTEVTAIGYGNTAEGGESSLVLLEVQSNTVSFNTCNSYYGTITDATQICMVANGKDTCQGDSGGPMIAPDGKVVGVVSFGDGCARDGVPSVFARTSGYEDWITEGICEHSDEPPSTCDETESPTKAPVVTTEQPTQAPASTTNSPTKAPTPQTQSPTKALVAQTQSPTIVLAGDQTEAPAVSQTTSPTKAVQTPSPTRSPVTGSTTSEPTVSPPAATAFPTPGIAQDQAQPTDDQITLFPTPSSKSSKKSKKAKKSKSEKGETSAPTTSRSPTKTPTKSPTNFPTTAVPTETPTNSPTNAPTTMSPTNSPTTAVPTTTPTISPTNSPTTMAPTVSPTTLAPTTSLSPTPQGKSKSKSKSSKSEKSSEKKKSSKSSEASPNGIGASARGNLLWFLLTGQNRDKPFNINDIDGSIEVPPPRKQHYQLEQWVQYNLELRESESEAMASSKSKKSKGLKKKKKAKGSKKKQKSSPGQYATIHPSVSPQPTTSSPPLGVPIDASQRDKKAKVSGELPNHVLALNAHLGISMAPSMSYVVKSKKSQSSKSEKGSKTPSVSPTLYPTVAPSTATPTDAPSTAAPADAPSTAPTDAPSTAFPTAVVGVVYDATALPTKMPTMAPTKKGENSKQKSSSSKKEKKSKYPTSSPTPN